MSAQYLACNSQGDTKINPVPISNDKFIFEEESHDLDPLIFYRISRPLKEGVELPYINLSDFYEESTESRIKMEITPNYSYAISDAMIEKHKSKYDDVVDSIKSFNPDYDTYLIDELNTYIAKNKIKFTKLPDEIEVSKLDIKNKELKSVKPNLIQARINAFVDFNFRFVTSFQYMIKDERIIELMDKGYRNNDTFHKIINNSKEMVFRALKDEVLEDVMKDLKWSKNFARVEVDRKAIDELKNQGMVDDKGEWTVFAVIMRGCQRFNLENLCAKDQNDHSWKIRFINEDAQDAGGPFRESLDNLINEVQSSCLPLLIPTQNNKNDHGPYRECWTFNPSSTMTHHLEMFKFFGALIAMVFRAGHAVDIKFPPMLWKMIIGETVAIEDLATTDLYAVQEIRETRKSRDILQPEEFDSTIEIDYTTPLSNGDTISLVDGGESKLVTHADVDKYCDLILKARVRECDKQLKAFKSGFDIVFPLSSLKILSWNDLEYKIRGPDEIPVDLMKSIATYEDCDRNNEFVKRFWRVFEEFDNAQRSLFLRFAWGRCRLPPKNRLVGSEFRLTLVPSRRYDSHDIHLPIAHTCFFNIELPRYSTDEICRSKLLYAITNCFDMDIY